MIELCPFGSVVIVICGAVGKPEPMSTLRSLAAAAADGPVNKPSPHVILKP